MRLRNKKHYTAFPTSNFGKHPLKKQNPVFTCLKLELIFRGRHTPLVF